jgi:hypothetical protein
VDFSFLQSGGERKAEGREKLRQPLVGDHDRQAVPPTDRAAFFDQIAPLVGTGGSDYL